MWSPETGTIHHSAPAAFLETILAAVVQCIHPIAAASIPARPEVFAHACEAQGATGLRSTASQTHRAPPARARFAALENLRGSLQRLRRDREHCSVQRPLFSRRREASPTSTLSPIQWKTTRHELKLVHFALQQSNVEAVVCRTAVQAPSGFEQHVEVKGASAERHDRPFRPGMLRLAFPGSALPSMSADTRTWFRTSGKCTAQGTGFAVGPVGGGEGKSKAPGRVWDGILQR